MYQRKVKENTKSKFIWQIFYEIFNPNIQISNREARQRTNLIIIKFCGPRGFVIHKTIKWESTLGLGFDCRQVKYVGLVRNVI